MPRVKTLETIEEFKDADKHLKSHDFKATTDTIWAISFQSSFYTYAFLLRSHYMCYLRVLLSKLNIAFLK